MNNFDSETMKNLNDIRNHIKENYPDSCIAHNSPRTEGNELLEEISDFFKYEILGFCGCGCPESSERSVRDYLYAVNMRTDEKHIKDRDERWSKSRQFLEEKFKIKYVTDDPLLQFMAYILDNANLTGHGSSINGAWIEDLGRTCLYIFDLELNELDRLENEEENEGK